MEEVGRLSSIMTTTRTQPKAATRGPLKGQTSSRSSKKIAMAAEEETFVNSQIRCWGC